MEQHSGKGSEADSAWEDRVQRQLLYQEAESLILRGSSAHQPEDTAKKAAADSRDNGNASKAAPRSKRTVPAK